jgi:hypothetical protein
VQEKSSLSDETHMLCPPLGIRVGLHQGRCWLECVSRAGIGAQLLASCQWESSKCLLHWDLKYQHNGQIGIKLGSRQLVSQSKITSLKNKR